MWKRVKRWIPALKSRKVRVALTTVIVAIAAEYGLNVPTELLMTILGVGISIILGIAVEDNGLKRATPPELWRSALLLAESKPGDDPK